MKKNKIIEKDGGWKVENGNAESIQTYESYEDALSALLADENAYAKYETEADAQDHSPIEWQ